ARRARGLVLLDPEYGARRRRAHAALRPRHRRAAPDPRPSRPPVRGRPGGRVPQPPAPLGRSLGARSHTENGATETQRTQRTQRITLGAWGRRREAPVSPQCGAPELLPARIA